MPEDEWQLVMEFPDQSASFCLGFEAGELWNRLSSEYEPIERTINADNREIMVRMAANRGWTVEFKELDDGWLAATFERGRSPTLRVVS